MNNKILVILVVALTVLTGCGMNAQPVDSFVTNVGAAHVEGDDVYFEYNGQFHVAKNQRSSFENEEGETMLMIQMSDGSYIIQNDKEIVYANGYDPEVARQEVADRKEKLEQERQAKLLREQQLEDERIEYLRSKEIHKQNMDQQKLDLKAEAQESAIQNARDFLQAQIEKMKAEK